MSERGLCNGVVRAKLRVHNPSLTLFLQAAAGPAFEGSPPATPFKLTVPSIAGSPNVTAAKNEILEGIGSVTGDQSVEANHHVRSGTPVSSALTDASSQAG